MTTKVLIVGGGAREHAIALALSGSPERPQLFAAMSNANPGIMAESDGHRILKETDVPGVVAYAREVRADLVAIGPEAPLEAGLSDALGAAGIRVAAPSQAAARIETDKAWMRALMARNRLPGRIRYEVFTDAREAEAFIDRMGARVAVKPVGLTGGKGVQVHGDHFHDTAGAMRYVREVLDKRIGGAARVVIEERLRGEEFTAQAFCDGRRLVPTPAVQDHKRLLPGDQGPNTGGMGAYSQGDHLLPFLTQGEYEEAFRILQSIVDALAAEGHPYRGPIYGQFMLTPEGPKVIEVNARFGDPEAMNVLGVLRSDLLPILEGMADGALSGVRADFAENATVVKYVVPAGYGVRPMTGVHIGIDQAVIDASGCTLYYAAVNGTTGGVTTTSSRALAVLGAGNTLQEANERCEEGLAGITSDHIHVRHDIGTKDLIQRRIDHMKALRVAPHP